MTPIPQPAGLASSAALRALMARNGQNPEFEIVAGGERYVWRLQRAAQDSGKRSERSGMALAVRHHDGQREAVLEFPPGPQPRFTASRINEDANRAIVGRASASALAAGWEPMSRGKPVGCGGDAAGG